MKLKEEIIIKRLDAYIAIAAGEIVGLILGIAIGWSIWS